LWGLVLRSVVMESAGIVHQCSGHEVLDRFVDRVQVRKEWLNSRREQVLLCSHSHPACNKNGNACKRRGHCSMLVILLVATFMATLFVSPLSPGMVAGLAHPVSFDNLSIPETDDLIVKCTAKMRADRSAIVGNECKYAILCIHTDPF